MSCIYSRNSIFSVAEEAIEVWGCCKNVGGYKGSDDYRAKQVSDVNDWDAV